MSEHGGHHIINPRVYARNFFAIFILMLLTVAFGKMEALDFAGGVNGVNFWIALFIAIAKMGCIMAFFMGVRYNTPLVRVFATASILWVCVFFAFVLSDYFSPPHGLGTASTVMEAENGQLIIGEYNLPE